MDVGLCANVLRDSSRFTQLQRDYNVPRCQSSQADVTETIAYVCSSTVGPTNHAPALGAVYDARL